MFIRKVLAVFIFQIFVVSNAFANQLLLQAKNVFQIDIKGVIHIGASTGQENELYKSLDVPVLWIEADPDTYNKLTNNVHPDGDKVITKNFAVSNKDGTATFFRTNNEDSSSLLELKDHKMVYPDVSFKENITVVTKKLDSYFKESKTNSKRYNAIVIDIQGAELMALEGAVDTLKNISCIISEVNYGELYAGAVRIWELDAFLLKHGFIRLDTGTASVGAGDALYVKKEIIENLMKIKHKRD